MIKTASCSAEDAAYYFMCDDKLYISHGCCLNTTAHFVEPEEIRADNLDNVHKKIITNEPIFSAFIPGEFDVCFAAKKCPSKTEIKNIKVGVSVCNLNCIMCETNDMNSCVEEKKSMFFKILNEYKKHGGYETLSINVCGEVFVWKEEILDYLENLKHDEFQEVFIMTNGQLIDDETIERLRNIKEVSILIDLSIDGVHKETLEKIRLGSSYEKTIEVMDKLKEAGLLKGCNYVVQKDNLDELEDAYVFFKEKGVKVNFILQRVHSQIGGYFFTTPAIDVVMDKRRVNFVRNHPDTILFNEVK